MKLKEVNSCKNFGFSCIYLWTNMINGKHYVGSAKNFYNRMSMYKKNLFNPHMGAAIEKYGIDNFNIDILEKDIQIEKLLEREQYWIDYYESYDANKGYNICRYAGNTIGYRHTDESRQKMSEAISKSRMENPDMFSGKNNGMYGKHLSKEHKEAISNRLKDLWENEEYRKYWTDRMSGKSNPMYDVHLFGEKNGMYGKHHSEETKQKIREKVTGHVPESSIKIVCLETNEVFESMSKAAKAMNTYTSAIKLCIDNPKRTCKGKHFTRI